MATLTKDGAVKTLTNEALVAALIAAGWVLEGTPVVEEAAAWSDEAEEAPKKRGRKGKGE